jgi:hypothetical protein
MFRNMIEWARKAEHKGRAFRLVITMAGGTEPMDPMEVVDYGDTFVVVTANDKEGTEDVRLYINEYHVAAAFIRWV